MNKNPSKFWKEYIDSDIVESAKDNNANANTKSFSNFVMELCADSLEEITRTQVSRLHDKIFKDGKADDFWAEEYRSGCSKPVFYFHDMSRGMIPYCYAASTIDILHRGRFYADEFKSLPPKRFDSFIGQVTEFIMELSQEHAGAIAVPDFFVNVASFFKSQYEVRTHRFELENCFQSMIFILHNKFRMQGQSPFTNVTIADETTLRDVFGIKSQKQIEIVKRVQDIYLGVFMAGTNGTPFRFPVTTFNLACDKKTRAMTDPQYLDEMSEKIASGLFNVYVSDDTRKFASCCRMINDVTTMYGIDSFGNGGINIGSTRVIAMSLPEIASRMVEGEDNAIEKYTTMVCRTLKAHRELLRENVNAGFLKFFKHGIENLDRNYFSTVGYVGLYEAAKILRPDLKEDDLEGIAKVQKEILSKINSVSKKVSKKLSFPCNLEEVPGESAAWKLAEKFYGNVGVCFSNQYVPLSVDCDILSRIKVAGMLDSESSGGAITHINLAEKITGEQAKAIVMMAAKHGMTHFAPNYTFTTCDKSHQGIGIHKECKTCGSKEVKHVTRIIGYLAPVEAWSLPRQHEYKTRRWT